MGDKNYLPADYYSIEGKKYSKEVPESCCFAKKFNWTESYGEEEFQNLISKEYYEEAYKKAEEWLSAETYNPFKLILYLCGKYRDSTYNNNFLELLVGFRTSTNKYLDDNIKLAAFNYFCSKKQSVWRLAIAQYKMVESKVLFVDKIKQIAKGSYHKEASALAVDLKLFQEFTIDDFLIPLFLKKDITFFYAYLDKATDLQLPVVTFLDKIVRNNLFISKYIIDNNLKIEAADHLDGNTLNKSIFKILKRYKLSAEQVAPNAHVYQKSRFLRYTFYEYYDGQSYSKQIYEDKMKEIVGNYEELKEELVRLTINYRCAEDAKQWIDFYQLDIEIPEELKNEPQLVTKRSSYSDKFYKMPIDSSQIKFIDSKEDFLSAVEVLKTSKFIGMDCEFQANNTLSLIQLAVTEQVFIIDALSLQTVLSMADWNLLIDIFNSPAVKKICFGAAHDIRVISSFFNQKITKHDSFIDFEILTKKLLKIDGFKFPYNDDTSTISLAKLMILCFNKELNKTLRTSSWSTRPLREEQIHYAATDAYCLLDIYIKIEDILRNEHWLEISELV